MDDRQKTTEQLIAEVQSLRGELAAVAEQRRAVAESLRRRDADFDELFTQSPAMLHSIDGTGRLTNVSDEWLRVLGYERCEVIGRRLTEFLPEESRRYAQEEILPAYLRTGVCRHVPYRFVKNDGELVDIELSAAALHDESGRFERSVAFLIDVTERNRAVAALRSSEEKFRQLAEVNRDVCWISEFTGERRKLDYISPVYQEIWGRDLDEAYDHQRWLADVHEDDRTKVAAAIDGLPARGFDIEYRIIRGSDREERWIRDRVYAVEDFGERTRVIGIAEDITSRKRTELELRQATERAQAASAAKTDFLANMSHELRTPLNAVLGYAQLLYRDQALTAAQRERVATIRRNGEHLLVLISDILDMTKIEAGRLDLAIGEFHLGNFLDNVVRQFELRARDEELSFTAELDSDLPVAIRGDETRLRQVLFNLLSNAIKFTRRGGVTLRVRWDADLLRFDVEDTGVGVAEDNLERIFQPFEQLGDRFSYAEGTGLGLPISRRLVAMMEGELGVDSEVGRGSRFWFTIAPEVVSPPDEPAPGRAPARQVVANHAGAGPAARPHRLSADQLAAIHQAALIGDIRQILTVLAEVGVTAASVAAAAEGGFADDLYRLAKAFRTQEIRRAVAPLLAGRES